MASSRRMRPAMASFVMGEARLLVGHPEFAGVFEVLRDVVAQDLQGPVHPGARRHSRLSGAAEVGVVEVGEPVRGGPHFLAHAPLFPDHEGVVGPHPGEQRGDGVAVADHHAVHSPDFPGLGLYPQPPGCTDQREGGFRTGAGDLHGRGPAWFRQ